MHTRRFAAFLLTFLIAAELDAGTALGIGMGKTETLEIIGAMLNMRTEFVFHVGIYLGALEERGDAETKRVEESHNSSGCDVDGPREPVPVVGLLAQTLQPVAEVQVSPAIILQRAGAGLQKGMNPA